MEDFKKHRQINETCINCHMPGEKKICPDLLESENGEFLVQVNCDYCGHVELFRYIITGYKNAKYKY